MGRGLRSHRSGGSCEASYRHRRLILFPPVLAIVLFLLTSLRGGVIWLNNHAARAGVLPNIS